MTERDHNDTETPLDLTSVVAAARSGRRRDVRPLVNNLSKGQLLVPLAQDVEKAREGERIVLSEKLELIPHLLLDADRKAYAPLFTRMDLVSNVESQLGWKTDGESLRLCALPAEVALQMALSVIDDKDVVGVVVNPGQPSELMLTDEELNRILKGEAIPLVGYVRRIVDSEGEEETLIGDDLPPPVALVNRLTEALKKFPNISGYSLRRTFNADRDLEPHLTLELEVEQLLPEEAEQIARDLVEQIEDQLPPPHYIDILFQTREA